MQKFTSSSYKFTQTLFNYLERNLPFTIELGNIKEKKKNPIIVVEVHLENARKRSKVYLEVVCPTCPLAEVKLGGTLAFHYGTLLNSESLAC